MIDIFSWLCNVNDVMLVASFVELTTIKFNTSTGEEYCEWFVCGVCGTEVGFDIK